MSFRLHWAKPGEAKSHPLDFQPRLSFETGYDLETRSLGVAEFRGIIFLEAIDQITGISLNQKLIDNTTIRRIGALLAAYAEDQWTLPPSARPFRGWEGYSPRTYRDLARLFNAYGFAGYELRGSW